MDNENNGDVAPQDDNTADELDGLDADALKEKYLSQKTKYEEIENKNRQLFERLKKEQGFERDPDDPTNWIKTTKETKTVKAPASKKNAEEQSGDLDYGQIAFFNQKSETKIEHEDDIQFLKDEMESWKMSQSQLLLHPYFLSNLKARQEERATKEATPSSSGRSGTSKKDVSYWKNQPYETVPEHMKYAVLDAIKEDAKKAQTAR